MADELKRAESETPGLAQRALAGHAAVGLLSAALLYLIALSGMLAVVHESWQRWEDPGAAEMTTASPALVQQAIANVIAHDGKPGAYAWVQPPTDEEPRVVVTTPKGARYIDAQGQIAQPVRHEWTDFILNLHYYLNLPFVPGMVVTGTLGVMLVVLALGGILAQPRIFRDAFRMRIRGQRQLAQADWHNRLAVWTLPFVLALGVTGAYLGIRLIVFQSIAVERYGGNVQKAYAPIYGGEPEKNDAPAALARVDRAMDWMALHQPDHRVTFVMVDHPQTAGQQITFIADHSKRLIYGEEYRFDGDGHFLGSLGLADGPMGRQAIASTYKLHFGNFGGLPVELAYLIFGLALCVIIATGPSLWLLKRRARGLALPRTEASWAVAVWGSPLLLALAYGLRLWQGSKSTMILFFWAALAVLTLAAIMFPRAPWRLGLKRALGCSLILIGTLHFALLRGLPLSSLVLDLSLVLGGIVVFGRPGRPTLVPGQRSPISAEADSAPEVSESHP